MLDLFNTLLLFINKDNPNEMKKNFNFFVMALKNRSDDSYNQKIIITLS